MSDDKRTKIGATGPARVTPAPATSTPAPLAEDASKNITEHLQAATPVIDHSKSYLPPAAPQVDPLIGATLAGRYLISKKLGEGGMGAVYLATHQLLEKQVALKVLHGEFARKPDLVERFIQEAKAASRIRHENVIDISDFGATPEGQVFFAMELLKGHDLHEEIARARLAGQLLPWQRSKKIFLQICSALAAAHARGIIHRDLKPENVYLVEFLGEPDFVKLLDFGIAKMTEVGDNERKLTRTGMLFGTPEYMSPEQARGEQVDARVDVYAMGCILFQLVTGRVPFEADNFMGVLSLHLTEPPPSIPEVVFQRIGAPTELAAVIDKALAKERGDRHATIDDLANAVRLVCGDAPLEGGRATSSVTAVRPASVPAPEVTKEARTTPAPVAPSTGEIRQRTQWTGNLSVPEAPPDAPTSKSKLPLILGGLVIAGAAGAAVFFATRGEDKPADPPPVVGSASGSAPVGSGSQVAVVTPDAGVAVTVPPPVDLPAQAEIEFDSVPRGAKVTDLTSGMTFKTKQKIKVTGSATPRQFKIELRGYSDVIVELVPNQATMKYTETLQRGAGTLTRVHGTGSAATPHAGSGSAVTRPDPGPGSATTVTSGSAEKPPDPTPKPDAGVVQMPVDDCDDPPCIKKRIKGMHCSTAADCETGTCTDGICQ